MPITFASELASETVSPARKMGKACCQLPWRVVFQCAVTVKFSDGDQGSGRCRVNSSSWASRQSLCTAMRLLPSRWMATSSITQTSKPSPLWLGWIQRKRTESAWAPDGIGSSTRVKLENALGS